LVTKKWKKPGGDIAANPKFDNISLMGKAINKKDAPDVNHRSRPGLRTTQE
jgi:hypothetical protein